MTIKLRYGIGKLRFGMTLQEVKAIYGEPDEVRDDDDYPENHYVIYNNENLLLTFYKNEGGKLGYIETTNPKVNYGGKSFLNKPIEAVKPIFELAIQDWEFEKYHSFSKFFNEAYWLTLTVVFDKVTGVELGVTFKDNENHLWPDEILEQPE